MMTLSGQRVLVMGLGAFGGGVGCVSWLLGQDALVTVTDLRIGADLERSLDAIDQRSCRLVLGQHDVNDFTGADLIVVNPAVPHPWSNPLLMAASKAGVPLTTEIALLTAQLDRSRCIGITGSAGKSTTASMTHHLLTAGGHHSVLGGNIGGSLLGNLDEIGPESWVVLELSSAQLYWLSQGDGWSPALAGITNITPNHLDWHQDESHYRDCKMAIGQFQSAGDTLLHPSDCPPLAPDIMLRVLGEHNRANAAMAIALASTAAPISPESLNSFTGLPHRLSAVGAHVPPRFIDDSKSTTPEATVLAVQSFDDVSRVHLIAGGYDKGISLDAIATLAPQLGRLYTIGATGEHLAASAGPNSTFCGTLEAAIAAATGRMCDGDVLLLSPGCASWDQFKDYRTRGEAFRRLVLDGAD
ncbi:MAG: hypothetical protein HOL13_09575 [Phycisphaerae bacterium]|nr:hypothetical protein [Phycisphaerae bacterium]